MTKPNKTQPSSTGVKVAPESADGVTPSATSTEVSYNRAVYSNAFILGIFALVSTGLIAITHWLTKETIAKEIELSLIRQLSEIVPHQNYNNDVYYDCILIKDSQLLGSEDEQKLYRMRQNKTDYALMMTLIAPDGYSGKISLALAANQNQEILGVNILSHNETPGLGDKIERNKSDWLNQFKAMSLAKYDAKDWNVKKDGGQFDALTGATITPRAVIKAVRNGLLLIQSDPDLLYSQKSNCYNELSEQQ